MSARDERSAANLHADTIRRSLDKLDCLDTYSLGTDALEQACEQLRRDVATLAFDRGRTCRENVNAPEGRLMDAATIMAELGVTRAQADRIIRWCNTHGAGAIRPIDGARKLYVERGCVERWLELSRTRSAA